MKLSSVNIIPFLFSLALATSCSTKQKSDTKNAETDSLSSNEVILNEEQFKNADIHLGQVEQRSINGTIKANGMLDVPPQNLVTVSAPLGGFVKNTELLQGMKVQKGQVIVTLEHPDYIQIQQDYLDLSSQKEYLQLEYQRQEALARENVNAGKALQLARSNYFSTKAKVQGLQAKLRLINIDPVQLEKGVISSTIHLYAPISGYITQVNVNIGMHVNPADVMFRIVDNAHLHAEAQVFEKDITKLKVGQKVRFMLSKDSRERTAKVYLIGKEITPDRTVRVHCHLDVEDPSLIPGMYFSAFIETDNQTVTALPEKAVVNFGNKDYVFVVKNEALRRYEMTEVKKGNSESSYVEVLLPDGLPSSTRIVVSGAYELLSFLKNKGE
jgi:cobalt-zinc-cadmium efflux system membrane fusion protein